MPSDGLDQALADLHRLVFEADDEPNLPVVSESPERVASPENLGDSPTVAPEASPPARRLRVRIELGRTRITRAEADALRQGGLLTLDRATNDPVDLVVDGRVVARGELLNMNNSLGIRISELLGSRP
jgi:flagellar motor switch protein FliN